MEKMANFHLNSRHNLVDTLNKEIDKMQNKLEMTDSPVSQDRGIAGCT
jgi:hypothetical protein